MGLQESELKGLVDTWRGANSSITKLWWAVDKAAKEVVRFGKNVVRETHGIRFEIRGGVLFVKLPSSRELAYTKPRMGTNKFGSESIYYFGVGSPSKKWMTIDSYGPKLVENIVQGIARDLLCHSISLLKELKIVMHVHDEIVIECPEDMSVSEVTKIMSTVPPWAKGLNLKAEGYECKFYMKK